MKDKQYYKRHTSHRSQGFLWKMRVMAVYDDEREEIRTCVSTYDMQGQSIKAN